MGRVVRVRSKGLVATAHLLLVSAAQGRTMAFAQVALVALVAHQRLVLLALQALLQVLLQPPLLLLHLPSNKRFVAHFGVLSRDICAPAADDSRRWNLSRVLRSRFVS